MNQENNGANFVYGYLPPNLASDLIRLLLWQLVSLLLGIQGFLFRVLRLGKIRRRRIRRVLG